MNDCRGTNRQPNSMYQRKDVIKNAFVHTYAVDDECKRTVSARLLIVAVRDVSSGEEITVTYQAGYWNLYEEQVVFDNPTVPATHAKGEGKKRKQGASGTDKQKRGKHTAEDARPGDQAKSCRRPTAKRQWIDVDHQHDLEGRPEVMRCTRCQTQASLSALPVEDFSEQAVQAAFDIFDKEKAGFGHVTVLNLKNDVALRQGCEELLQTDHVFKSHTNHGITFQDMNKQCLNRVEHGLHADKVRSRRKELFAEPLTKLVETHFKGTAFKEAWDTVATIIKKRWPKRQVLLVLMATGDCSKLSGYTTQGNVTFSVSGQLVLYHFDGFHVVFFNIKGQKDFRVAKHADIKASPASTNPNEAHHVSALHTDYAHLFRVAEIPEAHVMIMEVKTWHEVRSVLRHLWSVEL